MIRQSRRSFVCGFIIIIVTFAVPASSLSAAPKFLPDITGAYYFVEKPPKAFEDVNWIVLFAVDAKGREVPLNGFVRLKDRYRGRFVNFFLVNPTLRDHILVF